MTSDHFLANFGHVADATDGVKYLRELTLYFAITGGLSRPMDGDSSADAITESALRGKERYFEKRKTRVTRSKNVELPQITRRLPRHWKLIPAGELVHLINGRAFNSDDWRTFGLPIIRIQNLNNPKAPFKYFQGEVSEDHRVLNGDMLLSWSGTPGTSFGAFIWSGGDAVLNQHIFKVPIYSDLLDKAFLKMAINASLDALIGGARGGVGLKHVTKGQVEALLLPIPPVEEQKRIVAKADELMALCDQLEAQQQERERRFPVLSRTCHARFAEAPTLANLNRIFDQTGSVSPNDLRKTILNLAVQGRIVTQKPNEGTGESLLTRIGELQKKTPNSQQTKAVRRVRDIDTAKCSYDIPNQWAWCRLGDLALSFRYGTSRKCEPDVKGVPVLRIPNIKNGRVDTSDLKFTSMPDSEFEELRLLDGDLLLIRSNGSENLVGQSAVVSVDCERFAYAGYLVRARLPTDHVFVPYIHKALSSSSVRDQIEGPIRTTSGVKNLNTTELSNLTFPLPPLAEQRRIVAKVDELMALVDQLEAQLQERDKLAEAFAKACVASLTGTTQLERPEKMKAPKTELVSFVTLGKKPKADAKPPLAEILSQHKGTLPAKSLWQQSGLPIDAFYQQLKTEIAQGWIAPPAEAEMKIVEEA